MGPTVTPLHRLGSVLGDQLMMKGGRGQNSKLKEKRKKGPSIYFLGMIAHTIDTGGYLAYFLSEKALEC